MEINGNVQIEKKKSGCRDCFNMVHFILIMWYLIYFLINTKICEWLNLERDILNSIQNLVVLPLIILYVFLKTRLKADDIIILVMIATPLFISGIKAESYVMISALMFIVIAKDQELDVIIRKINRLLAVMILMVFLLYLTGIIENVIVYRNGQTMRQSLGFVNPGVLGGVVFQFLCNNFYLHRYMMRSFDFLLVIIATVFLFFVPNAQATVVCSCILLVLMIYYRGMIFKERQRDSSVIKWLMIAVAILCNLYSVIMTLVGSGINRITFFLDSLASLRLYYSNLSLSMFGITWMGQKVDIQLGWQKGVADTYLDNVYATLLIRYGMVSYLIYSLGFLILLITVRNKNSALFFILVLYSIYGLMSATILSFGANAFVLAFALVIFDDTKINHKEELIELIGQDI